MPLFFEVTDENVEDMVAFYPDKPPADCELTLRAFYYSGFQVPSVAIFVFYLVFLALAMLHILRTALKHTFPCFYHAQRARLGGRPLVRLLRTQVLAAPLLGRKHSEPYYVLGLRWLPVRAPLRGWSVLLVAMVSFNLVLLGAWYHVTPGDRNVYWPNPDSYRKQFVRYLGDRSCVLAMGQLPLAILTSGRRSPLALATGLAFSTSMVLHRWLARMVFLQASVHSFAYTSLAARTGTLAESVRIPYWAWGVASTAFFYGLTILAYGWLRTRAYELFVALHVVFGILALVTLYYHIALLQNSRFYVYIVLIEISAAIWAFDRVARFANRVYVSVCIRRRGTLAQARIEYSDAQADVVRLRIELPLSRLQLPGESRGAKREGSPAARGGGLEMVTIAPGHSVRVLLPGVQWYSDHPFTVINTGAVGEVDGLGYLDLLIRQQGGFTRALTSSSHARQSSTETPIRLTTGSSDEEVEARVRPMGAIVEGPYGALHYEDGGVLGRADAVLLFAGGVGAAWCVPYLVEVALRRPAVGCTLVWMIRDIGVFEAVVDQLGATVRELRTRAETAEGQRAPLRIELHITSAESATAPPFRPLGDDDHHDPTAAEGTYDVLEPFLSVRTHYGRASAAISAHVAARKTDTLAVLACGPSSLCDDVRRAANAALRGGGWADVCHVEECFAW